MNLDHFRGDFIHLLKMLTKNSKKRRLDFFLLSGAAAPVILRLTIAHGNIYLSYSYYLLFRDRVFSVLGQTIYCSGTEYFLFWDSLLLRDRVFSAPGQTVWLGSTHRREFTKERAFDMGDDERRHRLLKKEAQ